MTLLRAIAPQRPIIVSALGEHARLVAARLPDVTDDLAPTPRIIELVGAGQEATGDLPALTPADLEPVFREMLQSIDPDDAPELPGIAWIVIAEVDGQTAGPTWSLLTGPLLDAAAQLRDRGYRYTLTFVLVDCAQNNRSPTRDGLYALAETLHRRRLTSRCQVYLLRARLRLGGLMTDSDVIEQSVLAVRVLVRNWSDPQHADRDLSTAMGISLQIVGHDAGKVQVFGRLALRRIRSSRGEIAADCATERLEEFAERHIRQGRHVDVTWEPHLVSVLPPEFTPEADASIGDRLRRGPTRSFTGRPALLRPPLEELRRLEHDIDEWVASLRQWRREVRVAFSSVLGRVRGVSGAERDRVRAAIDSQAQQYWTDPTFDYPFPYLHEWLDRQRREWDIAGEERRNRAAGLRLSEQDDPRDLLSAPFAALRAELSVRPNIVVLGLCCLLVIIGAVAVLWESLGNLPQLADQLSWLGPEDADKGNLLRWIWISSALGMVLVAGIGSFYRTRLRWDRAYTDLIEQTEEVVNKERAALQREIFLVDAHWYDKTVSAGARHLERRHARLRTVERQLARVSAGAGQSAAGRSRIVRVVGEDDRAAIRERVSAAHVDALLRTPALAQEWIGGPVDRWVYDAEQALIGAYERVGAQVAGDRQSAIDREVRRALQEWDRQAEEFLPGESVGGLANAPRRTLIYAQGNLAGIAADALDAAPAGRDAVVLFPGETDELLLCTAQLGLTADVVASAD